MSAPLTHVSFADGGRGVLVPAAAGAALLDADGQPVAAHRDVAATEGGVLYHASGRVTFIDVFCGCGGASLGFLQAGMECVAAIDLDPWALATYWSNLAGPGSRWHGEKARIRDHGKMRTLPDDFEPGVGWGRSGRRLELPPEDPIPGFPEPHDPIPVRNVIRTDVAELSGAELLRIIDLPAGAVGVMHGSPPCQGFSVANSRRFIDDPRNVLYREFIRLVAAVRPHHVSMENVTQMLTYGPAWASIQEDLSALGYTVGAKILNAVCYGVPQFRPRAIVSANRYGLEPFWPVPTHWGDQDLAAFEQFPAIAEQVHTADRLTPNPEPTELCMVQPANAGPDNHPYIARLVERRGDRARLADPFGGRHEAQWVSVAGFGAHTRQQLSLFDVAAGGDR